MSPDVIGVFIPIVAIVFGIGVAIVSIITTHRQKAQRFELRHKERLFAMERGLDLPPEPDDPSLDPRLMRPRHLLRGLIWTFLGIGIAMMLWHVAGEDEAWIGAIPLSIGIGYLIFYAIEGRKESAAALEPPKG